MATIKQKKAFERVAENGGNVSRAMIEVGFSPMTAKTPQKLTESKGWLELMEEYMPDHDLAKKHLKLMNSTKIEHLVFPQESEALTDEDIREMLVEVNCKVRKIVHGETARHVYFWASDNKALKDGLDMAYKLKGSYAAEKTVALQVNLEPRSGTENELEAVRAQFEEQLKRKLLE